MNEYQPNDTTMNQFKRIGYAVIAGLLYFGWFGYLVGLRSEHIGLFVLCAGAYLVHPVSRGWLFSFTGLLLYWMIYDSLRICPNYKINPVHISEPYLFEKQWFGINTSIGRQTLNEYWAARTSTALDIMSALFYLSWVPVPMLFGIWLYRTNRPLFMRFTYGFLFVNLVGFVGYYLYPAAPPWYVEVNGFNFNPNTPRNAAGLENFDRLIGMPLFHNMYQRNSNVFAAIPSLHSAYPFLTLLYAWQVPQRWPKILFVFLSLGIWFSAVYLRHHYLIDVLLGVATAIIGFLIYEKVVRKIFFKPE